MIGLDWRAPHRAERQTRASFCARIYNSIIVAPAKAGTQTPQRFGSIIW